MSYHYFLQLAKYTVNNSSVSWNIVSEELTKSCQCSYIFISSYLFIHPVFYHMWIYWNRHLHFKIIGRQKYCTVFYSVYSVQSTAAWGDSGQSSWVQQSQMQSSTVEAQDLPVCTTEVYFHCELQRFTEAFSRSQWSLQCIKLLWFCFQWTPIPV